MGSNSSAPRTSTCLTRSCCSQTEAVLQRGDPGGFISDQGIGRAVEAENGGDMADRRIENRFGKKRGAGRLLSLRDDALEKAAAIGEAAGGKSDDEPGLRAVGGD